MPFIALFNESFGPLVMGGEFLNEMKCTPSVLGWKESGLEQHSVCACECVCEHVDAALTDTVCSYTEKRRKSESGLSVISVTLSGRLPLTNERC